MIKITFGGLIILLKLSSKKILVTCVGVYPHLYVVVDGV